MWTRYGHVFHGHDFLLNYFQARYSLHYSGFRLRRPLPSNISGGSLALFPFVSLFTRLSQRKAKQRFADLV